MGEELEDLSVLLSRFLASCVTWAKSNGISPVMQ